jgi:hypothetical protein
MWNIITTVIPVIIGGNWNRLKIIQKIPEQHTGKARNQELQKTAVVGTAHVLREVLM